MSATRSAKPVTISRKRSGPRAYISVTNPDTKKSTGLTVRGLTADEVVRRIEQVFTQSSTDV